jgi:hypothetical protein
MATTSYLTPEDQAFINAWRTQTTGTSYAKWGTTLPKLYSYADKLKEIQSYYTDAKTPETKQLAIDLGIEWLKANNPGVLDSNGNEFKPGFYADIISGDKTTQKSAINTLNKIRDTNATQYVDSVLNADGTLGTAQKAAEITKITQGTTADSYNPTRLATAINSIRSNAIVKPGTSVDTLKAAYGGLKDSKGVPVFTDTDFKAVADATSLGAISKFNSKLDTLANNVLKAQQGSSYVTADPVKTAAAKKALISDPTNFVTSVNALNKPTTTSTDTATTTTDTTTTKPTGGIASLRTWHAPQQGVVTANSPYSGLLDATLAKITGANFGTPTNNAVYKNLTDPLTQGMGLDSLAKPKLTYDATNEAGITGLGNVSGTLDKLNTQVTSSPTYNQNQIANANTALDNAAKIAGVDPNAKITADKLAAGKMKWMQDLQNSSSTPVDYYTKLANNTLYSDLASTGKAALESYKSLPAVAPEVAKSTYLQEAQTSSKTPVEYYTKLANSTAYPDLQAAGQSGLAALNAQQNASVTTPITQQPLGTPQQFTLTSPNQPQSVTLGSGVAGVVDPSVVSKSNLNTDASSAYGTGIVPNLNQQAQAASVPFTSAQQVVDLQKLQNTPGITAEQYYAALAANPTYAAAGQSGIAALQNKPAPIVPAAPQGTPQTFTLT